MKRLITASLLFLFLCTFCVFENIIIEHTFSKTVDEITELKKHYVSGKELTKAQFEKVYKNWMKNNRLLTAFIGREQINEISTKLALLELTYEKDKKEFLLTAEGIILQLTEIESFDKINVYGIL